MGFHCMYCDILSAATGAKAASETKRGLSDQTIWLSLTHLETELRAVVVKEPQRRVSPVGAKCLLGSQKAVERVALPVLVLAQQLRRAGAADWRCVRLRRHALRCIVAGCNGIMHDVKITWVQ